MASISVDGNRFALAQAIGGASPASGSGTGISAIGGASTGIGSGTTSISGTSTPSASTTPSGNGLVGTGTTNPAIRAGKSATSGTAKPIVLTLDQVVAIVLGNNTAVIEARQRLQEAVEQINQLTAQEKPQLRADAVDSYNTYSATTTTLGPTVANPVLPSGGTIPTLTDQAASTIEQFTTSTSITGTVAPGIADSSAFGQSGSTSVSGGGTTSPTSSGTGLGGASGVTSPGTVGISPGSSSTAPAASSNPGTPSGLSPASSSTGAAGNGTGTTPATDSGSNSTAPSNGTGSPGIGDGTTGTGTSTGTAAASQSLLPQSDKPSDSSQVAVLPTILQTYILASSEDSALLGQTDREDSAASNQQAANAAPAAHAESADLAKPNDTTGSGGTTGNTASVISSEIASGQRNTYAARVSGSQYIDLFGYYGAARGVQYAVRDFYTLDLERTLNETALTAKSAFFNVLFAQAQLDVEQEQVGYSTENLRIVTARRQQGIAADYDVLTAQTALANAQQLLISAQNQVQLANSQLAYLVGLNPDQSITLQTPALPAVTDSFDSAYSVNVALGLRPELRQASRNVDMANRLVKLAGATLSPTLGIVGTAEYDSVTTVTEPHNVATISAQLGIPIDDGGATRSRVRSAKIQLQTQQLNLSALKLSVSLEVRQAILNVINAQTRVKTSQVGVTTGEEAVRLANIRYENGLGTFLDITNALAQLSTARNDLADAQFSYETALATLVRNEGGR